MNYRTGFMASMVVLALCLISHLRGEIKRHGLKNAMQVTPLLWVSIGLWIGAGLIS